MTDKSTPIADGKEITSAELTNHLLTDEERLALLEKVKEKLKGKMIKMTEEEIDNFFDTRGF